MNLKHGLAGTSIYFAWQNLKRSPGGVCLSWRDVSTFVNDIGPRPSTSYWLFRARPYQRSRPGNVKWRLYRKPFRDIWKCLTPDEIIGCIQHIEIVCARGGYDLDAGINELYTQNLETVKDPVARTHSWIKRYLPCILADLKKRRGETCYNEEMKYENNTDDL